MEKISWTDRVKMTYDVVREGRNILERIKGGLIGIGYILPKNCLLRDVIEG